MTRLIARNLALLVAEEASVEARIARAEDRIEKAQELASKYRRQSEERYARIEVILVRLTEVLSDAFRRNRL